MPIYEYKCTVCGKQHELMHKHNDTPLLECSACGGHMKKLISQTSFVLKGTGWYATDYASGDRKKAEKIKKGNEAKTETKAENKPEAKTEPAVNS